MNLKILILLTGLLPGAIGLYAQSASCNTGQLDPRVKMLSNILPDMTMEEERSLPLDVRRKSGPPNLHPIPENKLQRIKITADSIPVIVYRPEHPAAGKLPVLIDYHGGGFVAPLQPWMYSLGYGAANALNVLVFQVDYPVAPEHRFPAAVTAGYKAFEWLSAHAGDFGGDTARVAVTGASAGGNIATVVTMMATHNGLGGRIKFLSLLCPILDNPLNSPYASFTHSVKGYPVTRNDAIWAVENYVGPAGIADTTDYRLFPIRAKSFRGLPPTLVFTAEFDVLRDEGEAFANKLQAAGVPTAYRCFPGELHVLAALPPDAAEWQTFNEDTRLFMKKYW